MNAVGSWEEVLEKNQDRYLNELLELLRIPSISTDSASVGEVLRAADWVAARLKKAGLENVEILPTGPHACVYADWLHAPGKPTALIYGHFDVQPADPLELWNSPPFEPRIENDTVYARGAADMKGNLMLSVAALEALLSAEGQLPMNVKILFEGQEEIGSRDLGPFVHANREKLACDIVFTPDGSQWEGDQPAIWLGVKGMCGLQIDLKSSSMDLHSGMYGGAVPNANHALAQLLASLRGADGRILVEGFYDQVAPLSADEKAAFASVPFNEATYEETAGVSALVGEPGYSTYERAWARPTLEVNGMWGGYQGDGVKTVIPAQAHAKITCRLVPNQDPVKVLDSIEAHVRKHAPVGAEVSLVRWPGNANAYRMPKENQGVQAIADVLREEYGQEPYYVMTGGTLPIMDMFLKELDAYSSSVGFGRGDERIHSPNEFFRLGDFRRGQRVYAKLLHRVAKLAPGSMKP